MSPASINYRERPRLATYWRGKLAMQGSFDKPTDGPNVVGDPKLHRRGDPQRLMHTAEIVVRDIERHRRFVIF